MQINVEINCESELWDNFSPVYKQILNHMTKVVCNKVGFSKYARGVDLSVLLADNDTVRALNNDYRNKDKPTNVLSFPSEEFNAGSYEDVTGSIALGDLAFAFEIIESEAKEQEKSFNDHFTHLAVHGILHLLGYDHIEDNEAEDMEQIEVTVLKAAGISNPY